MNSFPDALHAVNRRGILAMSAGTASFVINDSIVKVVSESLPAAQLIFVRGAFATLLLLAVVHAMGASRQIAALRNPRIVLRGSLDAVATMVYLTSLFHLPLGEATAINMATPLFITAFAVLVFRERVGAGRWVAIAAGFTGVLLIVQPSGAAFNAYALLCLLGTLLHAARDLSTRYVDPRIPSILITLSSAIAVTCLSGALTAAQAWTPVTGRQLALLATASVFLAMGYYLLIVSLRAGEMSLIAPFRYTGLLFALLLGYLVWGDVPNALACGGIALLVGAGLYVLHGQRSRGQPKLEPVAD